MLPHLLRRWTNIKPTLGNILCSLPVNTWYHASITVTSHITHMYDDLIVISYWCQLDITEWASSCDNTVTSWWCGHLVYLWHHTVTTLWPHDDVFNSYHCDLTNNSYMWCHNFDIIDIIMTSHCEHCSVTTLWPHGDVVISMYLWHHNVTTMWPHSDVVILCICDIIL